MVDIVENWNHVIIFWGNGNRLWVMATRHPEKISRLSHLHAPIPMMTRDNKNENDSLSHLHQKNLTKDSQKKMPHCPVSIKNFFCQKATRKKLPHCPISMKISFDKRKPEKNSFDKRQSEKNCLIVPSSCSFPHAPCSCPHVPVPKLLSTCFHCHM